MTLSTLYRLHRWRDNGIYHNTRAQRENSLREKDDKTPIKIEHTCNKGPMIIKKKASRTIIERLISAETDLWVGYGH